MTFTSGLANAIWQITSKPLCAKCKEIHHDQHERSAMGHHTRRMSNDAWLPVLQGLGKTITGLALILRTRGRLADPPRDQEAQIITTSTGKKLGYYLVHLTQLAGRSRSGVQRKSVSSPTPQGLGKTLRESRSVHKSLGGSLTGGGNSSAASRFSTPEQASLSVMTKQEI